MLQETLIKFIKEKLAEGFSKEAVKETLLSTGYTPEEIENAFIFIKEREQAPVAPVAEGEKTKVPKRETPIETPREEKPFSYQLHEQEIPYFKSASPFKKFLLPLVILVALILVIGASAFIYDIVAKPDPISLLPQDTAFYIRFKINPENQQVKNFKELLNKFPYYGKLAQNISEEFEKGKNEVPVLKNLDFTIANEAIFAWITPLKPNEEIKEIPIVFILPNPDLKKLEKLEKDIQSEIGQSKDWRIEQENYKGRIIVKAIPTEKSIYRTYPGEPKLEPSTTLTNGHFILASKSEDIKKIIDVAEDQKITNILKSNKIKSINSSAAYNKIKKYLPKDYLALFYGEFNLAKILNAAEKTETVKETEKLFSPLAASLKTALELPFFKGKEIEEPEKVSFAGAVVAEKDGLKMEGYSLDLRKDAFSPSQFSLEESLSKFLPERIGNRELAYYTEGKNLKAISNKIEREFTKSMTPEEKKNWDDFQKYFEETLGINLQNDIFSLFEKNYAFLISSDTSGKEIPVAAFIAEVNDENTARSNLLKIKFPNIEKTLELERQKGKDIAVGRFMDLILNETRRIYDREKSYKNANCQYNATIKIFCDGIKKQVESWPVIHQSRNNYCAYTKLNEIGAYYCIDNTGTAIKTYINPGGKNYCTGKTFLCPKALGIAPPEIMTPEEKVNFSKETIDGFEIYTLPVFENLGLNFVIKDKKLIFTFTKDGLVNVLKGLAASDQKALKDSQIFTDEFKGLPKEISEISYIYPYGFIGAGKSLVNYLVNYLVAFVPIEELETGPTPEFIASTVNEFLDKGVAPYLKVLRTASGYSYSPEKGLSINKSKINFEDLSTEEKKATEDFWQNFDEWVRLKLAPYFGPIGY
jgi:hypothetical protein